MKLPNPIHDLLRKNKIPFMPLGNDFAIICPFSPVTDGTGSSMLTFNINSDTGSGVCAYCHKYAEFDEVCQLLHISAPITPSVPEDPRGAQISPNVPDRDEDELPPEPEMPDPIDISQFKPITANEVINILGLTVKHDNQNKLIAFLGCLSAYTESSQLNISFTAPSSSGKSFIPLEIAQLFPKEDVREIGHCSPTAFFHELGKFEKEKQGYTVDLSRKILVFLDQPQTKLLEYLRPLLSHDKKEIQQKITDKLQRGGLRTKNVYLIGFPVVIFCTAKLRIDEQESTRFILLSPETNREKIRAGILEKIKKEADSASYYASLDANPERALLKERIRAIKQEHVEFINCDPQKVDAMFFAKNPNLKPRHQRDIGRIFSLIKAVALLNVWFREKDGSAIVANDSDIEEAFKIWDAISESQEFNLPPYVYQLHTKVILPAYEDKNINLAEGAQKLGITRREITQKHLEIYHRVLPDWQLRQEIIPMLENAGLIAQEPDPDDKRKILVYPTTSLTISPTENNSESHGGVQTSAETLQVPDLLL